MNAPSPLPKRVARPVNAAFGDHYRKAAETVAKEGQTSTAEDGKLADVIPHRRAGWSQRAQRTELAHPVTDFWDLDDDAVRFEKSLSGLIEASTNASNALFDAASRADLHRAWVEVRDAATEGTFIPRARVGTIGVSMSCDIAIKHLVTWSEADAAKLAFDVTGGVLENVIRQGRQVLVECAGQVPIMAALLKRVVKHLYPLPKERPTPESVADLISALKELSEKHPNERSRAAFAAVAVELQQ